MTPHHFEPLDLDRDPHTCGSREDMYLRASRAPAPRPVQRRRHLVELFTVAAALAAFALFGAGIHRALHRPAGARASVSALRAATVLASAEASRNVRLALFTSGDGVGTTDPTSTAGSAPAATGVPAAAAVADGAPSARRPRPTADLMSRYERYLAIGHAHFFRAHAKKALVWYRKAARLIPGDERAWWAMGRAYHDRHLNAKAKRYLEHALRLNPKSDMAVLVLASVDQEEHDVAGAASSYAGYLSVAPDGTYSKDASVIEASMRDRALALEAAVRVGPTLVSAR